LQAATGVATAGSMPEPLTFLPLFMPPFNYCNADGQTQSCSIEPLAARRPSVCKSRGADGRQGCYYWLVFRPCFVQAAIRTLSFQRTTPS